MKSKKKERWCRRRSGQVVLAGLHLAHDLATEASRPRCRKQVVLYLCFSCKRPAWPNRE